MVLVMIIAFLLLGCAEVERDNPCDQKGPNYNLDCFEKSSSSVASPPNSSSSATQSSSSVVASSSSVEASSSSAEPSSSSVELSSSSVEPSSSSAEPSSSSVELSSSSVEPSSSSAEPSSSSVELSSSSVESSSSFTELSSSSVAPSSSSYDGLCIGFNTEAQVEHYGKMKNQFCDERDGKRYVYVIIGEQTWMAENLNYNVEGSRCYDDSDFNCETYGRLYDWPTAMNNTASSAANPSEVQGVCPADWHLPSDDEWTTLTNYVGNNAGRKLKATSGWTGSIDGNGTDNYGFSALPGGGGLCNNQGRFCFISGIGYWWNATVEDDTGYEYAYIREIIHYSSDVNRDYRTRKLDLLSVRCVKD